jgi:hypothetical protein
MFVEKDLFNKRWSLSLYRSRTVENVAGSVLSAENPVPKLYIIFGKQNFYYYRILTWLLENNISHLVADINGEAVELTIIFNF